MMEPLRIFQLPTLVADQIAAGEVVERPASVVKELIENSLDAKATKIELEVEGAGMHLIRVRDNGVGIVKEDLPLAFSRHATSKIKSIKDLSLISSLGFRGEALASIASISRCRLISRPINQNNAWQTQPMLDVENRVTPCAHPFGTTIEVADLFYNTPVRRKFLRSEKTEFQAIEAVFKRLAIAFPEVCFALKNQQKQVRYYPKGGWKSRIGKIMGERFLEEAKEISMEVPGLKLEGWIGLPKVRPQGEGQYFFVNQRMLKDRILNHVIRTIYQQHSDINEGIYPCYVLFLSVDPNEVDVNVHPTKQEVRFSHARMIHDFIGKAIRDAISSLHSNMTSFPDPFKQQRLLVSGCSPKNLMLPKKSPPIFQRYVFIEEEKGIVIVDFLKARNTLIKDYFEKNWGKLPTRRLLFPLRMNLENPILDLDRKIGMLLTGGFSVRVVENEIILLHQPVLLNKDIDQALLLELLNTSHSQKALIEYIGDHLAFCLTDKEPLMAYFSEWIKKNKGDHWARLDHAQIESLFLCSS